MVFENGRKASSRISLYINGEKNNRVKIKQVPNEEEKSVRLLGFWIDEKMSLKEHFSVLTKKISKSLFFMSRVKRLLSLEARKLLYFAHVHSHLIYCLPLFTLATKTEMSKLIKIQKRALRIVFNKSYNHPSSPLFHDIVTLPLDQILEREAIKMLHSISNFQKPETLAHFFKSRYSAHNLNLRISLDFDIPFIAHTKLIMHPLYALPRLWNNSKTICKYINNREEFLKSIRNYFFSIQECNMCSKKYCKICKYEEWIKFQKSKRNIVVKSTHYIRYSTNF